MQHLGLPNPRHTYSHIYSHTHTSRRPPCNTEGVENEVFFTQVSADHAHFIKSVLKARSFPELIFFLLGLGGTCLLLFLQGVGLRAA